MENLFLYYPACDTCRKARKWLTENHIEYHARHIVENNPTASELKEWISGSGLPVRKFFNTSGVVYRELKLKEKLAVLTEEEQINLLATDGKLIKRPLFISGKTVLVGFKADEWSVLK